ncbi:hypothetical protein [Priestia aryabhattai]|uniref:hypothetical protein n=1 Tax=Priestia aryabhattai TaxID=412384 RepID=UPI0018752596|nr:hypothetical protein [Priestia aryabhattai]MBE5101636.1 hypothetical protein [Priestia aryabhattai]
MIKRNFGSVSTILFVIGVILAFFTTFSNSGLILIAISIGMTCVQLADSIKNKMLQVLISSVSIIVTLTIGIFIVTGY